jgi:hypothetical protein
MKKNEIKTKISLNIFNGKHSHSVELVSTCTGKFFRCRKCGYEQKNYADFVNDCHIG